KTHSIRPFSKLFKPFQSKKIMTAAQPAPSIENPEYTIQDPASASSSQIEPDRTTSNHFEYTRHLEKRTTNGPETYQFLHARSDIRPNSTPILFPSPSSLPSLGKVTKGRV